MKLSRRSLSAVYDALLNCHGPQYWWPGDSPFEIMVGAVLTQNTAWSNVEKAIGNLVTRNKLDANQARLVWWGDGARKPGGPARDAERLLGDFLCGRALYLLDRVDDGGHIYVISDGVDSQTTRILVAFVPNRDSQFDIGDLRLDLPNGVPNSAWEAATIQSSANSPPDRSTPPVAGEETALRIHVDKSVAEPLLILLRRPETEGATR